MKKIVYLIACSLVATIFFMVPKTYAASYGDNYYVPTDSLKVNGYWVDTGTLETTACNSNDITSSYMSVLSYAASHNTAVTPYYSSLLYAMSNGGVWGVATQEIRVTSTVTRTQVIVAWSEDPTTVPVQFIQANGIIATPLTNTNNHWKMLTIQGAQGNQSNNQCSDFVVSGENLGAGQWAIFSTSPTDFVSGGSFLNAKLYFLNGPVDYPLGYAGLTIPDTGIVHSDSNLISPAWRYSVTDKDIELQSLVADDILDEYHINVCLFRVPNDEYGDNYSEYVYDCKARPIINHTFSAYGSYNVIHILKSSDGDEYQAARTLTIDGSTYNGIIGGPAQNNSILAALGGIITNTHGLSNVITAPLQFIATLPNKVSTCSSVTIPMGHLGNITLPCMTPIYQANLGSFFTMWQTILLGLFSYAMGLSLFHKIKNITSPDDDRIEVVNL